MQDHFREYIMRVPIRYNTPRPSELLAEMRRVVRAVTLPDDHPKTTIISCGVNTYSYYGDARSLRRQVSHAKDSLDRLEALLIPPKED